MPTYRAVGYHLPELGQPTVVQLLSTGSPAVFVAADASWPFHLLAEEGRASCSKPLPSTRGDAEA